MQSHGSALEVKISIDGLYQDGSSRLEPYTRYSPGRTSAVDTALEPHLGQKPRLTSRPLSPRFVKNWYSPVIVKLSLGTAKADANVLPVARWQSRQWQLKLKTGSDLKLYRKGPQRQPPVRTGCIVGHSSSTGNECEITSYQGAEPVSRYQASCSVKGLLPSPRAMDFRGSSLT